MRTDKDIYQWNLGRIQVRKIADYLAGNDRRTFFLATLYVLLVGLLAQFWIIPSHFHDAESAIGLIPGTDAHIYHQGALALLGEMQRHGWAAWQLRPDGHTISGITGALYYLLAPIPVVILPLNAVAHGLCALCMVSIGAALGYARQTMRLAVLPFIFFPGSLIWLIQINKDPYFILGMFLMVRSWVSLVATPSEDSTAVIPPSAFRVNNWLALAAGVALIWFIRPYVLSIVEVALAATLVTTLFIQFCRRASLFQIVRQACMGAAVLLAMQTVSGTFEYLPVFVKGDNKVLLTTWEAIATAYDQSEEGISRTAPRSAAAHPSSKTSHSSKGEPASSREDDTAVKWAFEDWAVSKWVSKYLHILIYRRLYYVDHDKNAASRIDTDRIYTIADLPGYFPRAVVVGFFLPTAWQWIHVKPGLSQLAMLIAGIEILMVNGGLAGLLVKLCRVDRATRANLMMLGIFAVLLVTANVYAVPNLGTLYRLRYPPVMLIAVLGWAFWIERYWPIKRPSSRRSS